MIHYILYDLYGKFFLSFCLIIPCSSNISIFFVIRCADFRGFLDVFDKKFFLNVEKIFFFKNNTEDLKLHRVIHLSTYVYLSTKFTYLSYHLLHLLLYHIYLSTKVTYISYHSLHLIYHISYIIYLNIP